ncbi:hypothetical protein RHMOL_Rhmol11G0093800 [Rhododendron molle]|uniref:Uncharacterized protein n=1 Tax=Rhododendron molle TaxID=49168 RepID=A0ACC0LQ85_RHOML|nr:hypothetical protein RHMOL_Rhmol11G0093800 [Rhododendron molle]
MVQEKGKGKVGASSSAPAPDIVEEQASLGSEEPVVGKSVRRSRKHLHRTRKQVQADKRVEWKEGMMKRKFKSERQVKAKSVGTDHFVIQRIWSKGRGKDIMIDPAVIAKYLGYERPPPESVNYPRDGQNDDGLITNVLYMNPKMAIIPHVVGEFRDDIRVLNKAFHHNLYPRGLEHKPSWKTRELMYTFMNSRLVVGWAKFIFNQLVDFKNNMITLARMSFPCMITTLCKQQGVKGNDYKKMERLDPGPTIGTFLKKSKPRSSVPRPSSRAYLTTKPGPKEKKDNMLNKLFCRNVAILKCLWKSKEKRKKDKKERR